MNKENTVEQALEAGWVLLEYELFSLSFTGRDLEGNIYQILTNQLSEVKCTEVELNGKRFIRCKGKDLRKHGALFLAKGNVADNRR